MVRGNREGFSRSYNVHETKGPRKEAVPVANKGRSENEAPWLRLPLAQKERYNSLQKGLDRDF